MLKNFFFTLLLFLYFSSIAACSFKKDSDIKSIDIRIITSKNLNPDEASLPSPLQMDLYWVQNTTDFTMQDYSHFSNVFNDKADMDSKPQAEFSTEKPAHSWILQPDSFFINKIDVGADMEYMGIITHYQDLNNSDWKSTFKKQKTKRKKNYYLYLYISDNSVKQLSKDEMKELLKQYSKSHPNDDRFTKKGKLKKQKIDYSKGVFIQNNFFEKNAVENDVNPKVQELS